MVEDGESVLELGMSSDDASINIGRINDDDDTYFSLEVSNSCIIANMWVGISFDHSCLSDMTIHLKKGDGDWMNLVPFNRICEFVQVGSWEAPLTLTDDGVDTEGEFDDYYDSQVPIEPLDSLMASFGG